MSGVNLVGTSGNSVSNDSPVVSRRALFKSLHVSVALVTLAGFHANLAAETMQSSEEEFWKIQKSAWDREQATRRKLQISSAQKLLEPLARMMGFHSQDLLDRQTRREVIDAFNSMNNNGIFNNSNHKIRFVEAKNDTVKRIQSILNANNDDEWKRNLLSEYFHNRVYIQYKQNLGEYRKYENIN
jgi:hypothetical protein